jgi:hypothetical protein
MQNGFWHPLLRLASASLIVTTLGVVALGLSAPSKACGPTSSAHSILLDIDVAMRVENTGFSKQ